MPTNPSANAAHDQASELVDAAHVIDTIAQELAGLHDHWQLAGAAPESVTWLAGVLHRLGYVNARLHHAAEVAHG